MARAASKTAARARSLAPARGSWLAGWWPAPLLAVAAALAFATSLDTPFFMDDGVAIVRNPHLTSLTPLSRAISTPPQSPVAGRPLVSLSLAATYAISGLDVRGFHTWNLVVHVLAGCVLFALLRRTLRHPRCALAADAEAIALVSALLWIVHPLHVEVIAYAVQRTESMMALCYLVALYAFARAVEDDARGGRWLVVTVVAGIAGACCKESMATLPVMVLLYDVVFGAGSMSRALRQRGGFYVAVSLTWVVIGALAWSGPRYSSAGFGVGISPLQYLITQAPIILDYLRLSVWPHPLVADYGLTTPARLGDVWIAVAIVAAFGVGTILLWRRHAPLAFLATWWFVTLSPASSLVPILTEVGAERRTYLPLIAVVVLIVLAVRNALRRWTAPPRRAAIAVGTTAVVVLVLGATSAARGRDYADPVHLWQTVLAARPHGRAHHNLGIELAARGRVDDALREYRLAAETVPEAHYSIGFVLATRNEPAAAAAAFRTFLAQDPDDALAPKATTLLGLALMATGDAAGAVDAYERTLVMTPGDDDARRGLAEAHTASGARAIEEQRFADASRAFARAIDAAPKAPTARLNYGRSLMLEGRTAQAEATFRAGLDLAPDDPPLIAAYAAALATRGALAQARSEFERALRLDPTNLDAQHGLSVLARAAAAPARR